MAVITISRQFGAGGRTLGKLLAKKMGYTLLDEDLIQKVADKVNVSKDWVRSIEQEAGGTLLKFMSGLVAKNYIERILGGDKGYIDEEIYVDALREIISQAAAEGNVVIVGRAGQYILQDYPGAIHVLLVAEKEDRLKFMEKNYSLSRQEAENVVDVYEKRRINLYRIFGKQDYDRPGLYHMVLNMSRMDMDKALELVTGMLSCPA